MTKKIFSLGEIFKKYCGFLSSIPQGKASPKRTTPRKKKPEKPKKPEKEDKPEKGKKKSQELPRATKILLTLHLGEQRKSTRAKKIVDYKDKVEEEDKPKKGKLPAIVDNQGTVIIASDVSVFFFIYI